MTVDSLTCTWGEEDFPTQGYQHRELVYLSGSEVSPLVACKHCQAVRLQLELE